MTFVSKIILVAIVAILMSNSLYAQSSGNGPATALAAKISQKLKDSLNLTGEQRQQLYEVNMQLHERKALARQQYADSDSLGIYIQRIENTRDSLYRAVLPADKYILYKEKKRRLVNNN